ncbi:hypothetical protein CA51_08500 [Rosistilla oblonga]|uniref:Uncharacterized protein n=2 Tax=Rosistilla TaxID=2795779 RepID=A0A518JMW7_9BACT|nr:hypothetical protein [Rosistilla carotiformis]QDV10991.1 hypothetical protein CA51_08500 [Rosistilla oblonga]QDV66899.1 hypothetical protein Poly24_05880 [Rosistilla carotiformis]
MTQNAMQHAVRQTKIERARRMTLDERLAAGAQLYAQQCELVADLIAGLHPDWTTDQVRDEMKRRWKVARERDAKRLYRSGGVEMQDERS